MEVWKLIAAICAMFSIKLIGPITTYFFYIKFAYQTTDNQQEFSKLSNWFSLFRTVDELLAPCLIVHFKGFVLSDI